MALTDKQRRFVDEYLIDLNATQAAIRAGYSERTARSIAQENLTKPDIVAHLAERRKELASNTAISPEAVLQRWWDLANVDVNEIVEYRRQNCRHCWGIEFGYQWTHGEFEKAQRETEDDGKPLPSCEGGFGFDHKREPNPLCPECGGDGHGKIHVHDTRRLTGAARRLYAGVHQGKDGLKVLTDDRLRALDNVSRILGVYNDKRDDDGKALAAEKLRLENDRLRKSLDEEIKALEIARRKAELAAIEKGGGNSNAQLLAELISKLPS
ncbi:Terminase small subunit [Paraburkholderia fungorum]|uniref:Terminase small subunit n=1 Tax=Paraburkholderia fungorum TaxID=134537 RepID=A0A1H1III3_9BURK|nr:terminase small subunit [Paraburkholderia fungorum]SDR37557.1 Terminase small subunit [Paraburkholderia fungorum]